MLEFTEGLLTFKFPEEFKVCKYDDSHFYDKHFKKLSDTKAVDFVIAKNQQQVVLIEVKDFRNYRIENKKRLDTNDLVIEIAQKVKDTIAGLYAAAIGNKEELKDFYLIFFKSPLPNIEVILFLEEDPPEASRIHNLQRRRPAQLDKLKKELKPFGVRCRIYNRSTLPAHCAWNVSRKKKTTGLFEP